MEEERSQILDMLNEGKISPEEAENLINALEASAEQEEEELVPQVSFPKAKDDLPHFEKPWQPPFAFSLAVFSFSSYRLVRSRGLLSTLILTPFVLLSGIGALLSWWGRSGHWIYIHIKEKDGETVKISMPFPFEFASWILGIIEPYMEVHVDDSDFDFKNLNIAELLRQMGDEISEENPLIVTVDDDEDHVVVYIV